MSWDGNQILCLYLAISFNFHDKNHCMRSYEIMEMHSSVKAWSDNIDGLMQDCNISSALGPLQWRHNDHSLAVVYSIVYSDEDQRKHQSSASLAFVRGILRWPVNSTHKGPVTRKMFPFDDVIMPSIFVSVTEDRQIDWREWVNNRSCLGDDCMINTRVDALSLTWSGKMNRRLALQRCRHG